MNTRDARLLISMVRQMARTYRNEQLLAEARADRLEETEEENEMRPHIVHLGQAQGEARAYRYVREDLEKLANYVEGGTQ